MLTLSAMRTDLFQVNPCNTGLTCLQQGYTSCIIMCYLLFVVINIFLIYFCFCYYYYYLGLFSYLLLLLLQLFVIYYGYCCYCYS